MTSPGTPGAPALRIKTEKKFRVSLSGASPLLMDGLSEERIHAEFIRRDKPMFQGSLPEKICEWALWLRVSDWVSENCPDGLAGLNEKESDKVYEDLLTFLRTAELQTRKKADRRIKNVIKLLVRGACLDDIPSSKKDAEDGETYLPKKHRDNAALYVNVRLFIRGADLNEPLTEEEAALASLYKRARDHIQGAILDVREELPRQLCEQSLYLDGEGRYCMPVTNLLACLVQAGQMLKNGRRRISSKNDSSVPHFMSVEAETVPLIGLNEDEPWVVDRRKGKKVRGRRPDIIRPRFDKWGLTVDIIVDTKVVDVKTVKELFLLAGRHVGLGAFRPGLDMKNFRRVIKNGNKFVDGYWPSGNFGRFYVKDWIEIQEENVVHVAA